MGEIFCCCGCCLKLLSLLNVKKLKTDQIIHLSMTKERAAIALVLIVTSLMLNAREVIDLNRDWRFHRGDSKMWQAPDADDGDTLPFQGCEIVLQCERHMLLLFIRTLTGRKSLD